MMVRGTEAEASTLEAVARRRAVDRLALHDRLKRRETAGETQGGHRTGKMSDDGSVRRQNGRAKEKKHAKQKRKRKWVADQAPALDEIEGFYLRVGDKDKYPTSWTGREGKGAQ